MAFSFIITDKGITVNMTMLQELVQDNTVRVPIKLTTYSAGEDLSVHVC
jgi:hypothetical protein